MKYAIIGTGAIGGYYGGKLANAGFDVHFLLHSDYDYVRQHGIQVNSCNGDFHLDAPNIYNNVEEMPKVDVVIVALKSTNNHLLRQLLAPLLNPGTLVLMIQNGIGIEPDVEKLFPDAWLAAGLAFICSNKTRPGIVDHLFYGNINIGNYSAPKPVIDTLIADFDKAGVKAFDVDYLEARWKKAVWNMPFNGMSVVLNAQTDQLLADASTRTLIKAQMMEVVMAANALGVENIDEAFADKMIANTDAMVPYSPSMKLDHDYHRPMEVYYLYTRPIQEAASAGVDMPLLKDLEQKLLKIIGG
ncbi:MAG: putative 2-dehydropantoate 2-reductase [Prevotella sp.]|nr:putative 2-dehydropantoate 2-reductase [Prevotella sp.]MDD7096393.1 putative 2-dehydropantoate 2-reductase [Prevotellaceae bacterium]MDY5250422.1 putative 2-dehydropantoate 2-reductase [Prevotella sp.]